MKLYMREREGFWYRLRNKWWQAKMFVEIVWRKSPAGERISARKALELVKVLDSPPFITPVKF